MTGGEKSRDPALKVMLFTAAKSDDVKAYFTPLSIALPLFKLVNICPARMIHMPAYSLTSNLSDKKIKAKTGIQTSLNWLIIVETDNSENACIFIYIKIPKNSARPIAEKSKPFAILRLKFKYQKQRGKKIIVLKNSNHHA